MNTIPNKNSKYYIFSAFIIRLLNLQSNENKNIKQKFERAT
jgi:hypothetical protein